MKRLLAAAALVSSTIVMPAQADAAEGPLACGIDVSRQVQVVSASAPVIAVDSSGALLYATHQLTNVEGSPYSLATSQVARPTIESFEVPGLVRQLFPAPDGSLWLSIYGAIGDSLAVTNTSHYGTTSGVRVVAPAGLNSLYLPETVTTDSRVVIGGPGSSRSFVMNREGQVEELSEPTMVGNPTQRGVTYRGDSAFVQDYYPDREERRIWRNGFLETVTSLGDVTFLGPELARLSPDLVEIFLGNGLRHSFDVDLSGDLMIVKSGGDGWIVSGHEPGGLATFVYLGEDDSVIPLGSAKVAAHKGSVVSGGISSTWVLRDDGDNAWSVHRLLEPAAAPRLPESSELVGQVSRLYEAYFVREADQGGLNYWLSARASGMTLEAMSQSFAQSSEFRSRYGELSDSEFVDRVYDNVLGRAPDAEGSQHWTTQLGNGVSRGSVMTGFSEGIEFRTRTGTTSASRSDYSQVFRLYQAYFLRLPDVEGMCYWGQRRTLGDDLSAISESFAGSPEFTTRYGKLSDEGFVRLVYQNVLVRQPDAAGLAHWTAQLGNGVSRGSVMIGFSESLEYVLRTGTLP